MYEEYNELCDLIEQMGLKEKYKDIIRNARTLYDSDELFELCLENNKYNLLHNFKNKVWNENLVEKIETHLKEYCRGITSTELPELFYSNSKLLDEALDFLDNRIIAKFKDEAWTEENILKSFNRSMDSYTFSSFFEKNPLALKVIFKNNLFHLLKFVKQTAEVWTEENIDLYIEALKTNIELEKLVSYKSSYMLKRYLEEKILTFNNTYWDDKYWTEENIDLLCILFEEGKIDTYNKYLYNRIFTAKVAKVVLKKELKEKFISIIKEGWTEENIDLYIKTLRTKEDVKGIPPSELSDSEKVLKRYLELHSEKLQNFTQQAWTDENIKYYFDNYKLTGNFDPASNLLNNEECAIKALKLGYLEQLRYFGITKTNDELIDLICNSYRKYTPEKIPFYPCYQNKILLRKLIENNLLNIASRMDFNNLWDEELIDLYCKRLESYTGEITYKNTYINTSTKESAQKILHAYIKARRFEGINEMQYLEGAWSDENINDFLLIIKAYLENYDLPLKLYNSKKILNYYLDNELYKSIKIFNREIFGSEEIVKYVNLYLKGVIEKKDVHYIDNILDNTHYLKYASYMIIKANTYMPNEKNMYNQILNKENKTTYERFITEINSFGVFLQIEGLSKLNNKQIDEFFDERGPKQELLDEIIYNTDFIEYLIKNNIEIDKITTNKIIKSYISFYKIHPEIKDYIFIEKTNISSFFDEKGPKEDLYNYLINPNGVEFLAKIENEIPYFNEIKKTIIKKALEIDSMTLRKKFINYCKRIDIELTEKKINDIVLVLRRIENSNSTEIIRFKESLADQVLQFEEPDKKLEEVEKIFIKNNLPNVGKIFLVFKSLHPTYNGLIGAYSSPTLRESNDFQRDVIIFSDLIKTTIASNNRDFIEYLDKLEKGNKIYRKIKKQEAKIEDLNEEEKILLRDFLTNVEVLYNNTIEGKKNSKKVETIDDIEEIKRLLNPNTSLEYELPDRIVSMFTHAAGFDSIKQIKEYQKSILKEKEQYHKRLAERKQFILKKDDLVKGINNTKYLRNILQNGILCKEYLGDSADSDATPLDTDLSTIKEDYNNNQKALDNTMAGSYGSTYLVFKNDSKFKITRGESNDETILNRKDREYELFRTGFSGSTHYGIRTGIPSSEIEYIITKENPRSICLDIAINGIYIPVVDINGNLLFSYDDYLNIRKSMQGLSYYGENNYEISNNVIREDVENIVKTLYNNEKNTKEKRNKIIDAIKKKVNLKIKTQIDKDLSPNSIEIIDTGSTGRGTNVPNDGDFDFIVRIDKEIMIHEDKLKALKMCIAEAIGHTYESGDFRFEGVNIEGIETPVDIDMTFITKTSKVDYATETCIKDRLNTIKEQHPDKYDYVLANIILAKKLFKKYECYKPKHSRKKAEGGLGGVGVENWILQHGGSLLDAAKDFLEKANGLSLVEFQKIYPINDFGANHMAEKKDNYPYDNYIYNMNELGFEKIKQALNDYIKGKVIFEENEEESVKTV